MIERLLCYLSLNIALLAAPAIVWSDGGISAITIPSADVTLAFVQPGRVTKINVKEGDLVQPGQVLIQQDDAAEQTQLSMLKEQSEDMIEIQGRKALLEQKRVYLERLEWAAGRGSATEIEVKDAKLEVQIAEFSLKKAEFEHEQSKRKYDEAKIHIDNMSLKSPLEGRVEKVEVEVGESIDGLAKVVRIVNTNPLLLLLFQVSGCVSGKIKDDGVFPDYQKTLVERGPQKRRGSEGLESLRPTADPRLPALEEIKDSAGRTTINLTLENAVFRALANSPEIMAVSFDPSIATENVAVEASKFDVTTFGKLEFNDKDSPSNNVSETGKSRSSLWDVGLKQKGITGAEWSLSYAMTHTVDESISRVFVRSYEPSLTLTVKQPLLRDAWPNVNLAGVTVAKLNYKIALADFRRQTEDVLSQVISLYWTLLQSRQEVEIRKDLLNKAVETLTKIEHRKGIDATMGDINQAEAAVKRREAALMDARKWLTDVQDSLVRLLGDSQMNLIDDLDIVPATAPDTEAKELVQPELLQLALTNNSEIARARLEVEIAKINLKVAKRQKMPLVDMVASAQLDGLSDDQGRASRMISDRDHRSYFLGVTFEYPFGNREKVAEFRQRELQHAKASSKLQSLLDQIAAIVKEKIRLAKTAQREIQVYKDAVKTAKIHLQVIEDIAVVRKRLTPEFLLTIIQAQESLADAQRAEIKAIADYNIALSRLSQATGMVLNLEYIKQNTLRLVTKDQ